MAEILLIHPPVAKPCEPPPGIARLCNALQSHRMRAKILDANLESLLTLFRNAPSSSDTWTSRALRHLPEHLHSLRSWKAYKDQDHYRRAINDLNRILERCVCSGRAKLSFVNYEHETLSPVRSRDLIRAAEDPGENPFYPYFRQRLTCLLENELPSLIGFSLNYLSQALCTFAMIGFLKRQWPGIRLVLGGGLITSWMRKPHWQNPFEGLVDFLVEGPGEAPLLRLMGIKETEHICHPPDYDSFPYKDYFAPGPILPYSASSGCYWNQCSFCPERAEGNSYHALASDRVIDHLHRLVLKHQPILIHLLDNALSPSLMKAMIQHPPGAPWYGFTRMTPHLANPDFCLALKQSGCVMLKLGLESGDQEVLDSLQKGIDLKEASLALKNLKGAGIATYIYLLFGTPREGLAEARRTLQFVVGHHEWIDFLNLAIFNMPVYGPEVGQIQTEPFYQGDLSLYTGFHHPKGWSRPLIRQFLDKEFKRHPAVSQIVRRDPPIFTSNHAPFFAGEGRKVWEGKIVQNRL